MTIQSISTSYSVRKSSNAKMLAWGITAVFPLILLFAGIYFRIILGDFPNDPDYAYLLNGINILRWHAPAQIDHPGTPVQLIAGLISGFVWLIRRLPWSEQLFLLCRPNLGKQA